MLKYIIVFILFSFLPCKAQDCSCKSDSTLYFGMGCDTQTFNNGARLLWNFNCDSSWITFENAKKERRQIYALGEGLQDYMGRLGYVFFVEFDSVILADFEVISGCCSPPEIHLFDKESGQVIRNLGRLLCFGEDRSIPFAIGFTNSRYDDENTDFNSLTVYNIDLNKEYKIDLPPGDISKALEETDEMHAEYLFEDAEVQDKRVILRYVVKRGTKTSEAITKTIEIDLGKYGL